jgi:predicted short-subunit dehydrogenase-like oxidoreductase (DUF2520 family)
VDSAGYIVCLLALHCGYGYAVMMRRVSIIGAGRVGGAIGHLLVKAGWQIAGVSARSKASAEVAASFIGAGIATDNSSEAASLADVTLISTPDEAIGAVCEALVASGSIKEGSVVVHMSGAHSLDLLDAAGRAGASRAVIHPLQSVPSRERGIQNIPGSYFRIEADPEGAKTVREMVYALGGIELIMPKWSADGDSASLYHAGAVVVSNYLVALIDFGLAYYQILGADKQEALKAVLPLIKGTMANVERLGTTEALTGPIVRGDVGTVQAHLEAMERRAPKLLPLYRLLAERVIALAQERGLDEEKVKALLMLVKG